MGGTVASDAHAEAQPERVHLYYDTSDLLDAAVIGKALIATSDGFKEHAKGELGGYGPAAESDLVLPKLYIETINTGSLSAWLTAKFGQIEMVTKPVSVLYGFAKALKGVYDFFSRRSEAKPQTSLNTLHSALAAVMPAVVAKGGEFRLSAEAPGQERFDVAYRSLECVVIAQRLRNEIALREQDTSQQNQERLLFRWHQATNDASKSAGDRGVVEEITQKPLKVTFANEDIKRRMIEGSLFSRSYLVDLKVHSRQGQPHLYDIRTLHEIFDEAE